MDFSYESENWYGIYYINSKHYQSNDMSPSGLDFDFRKSIDLGGHIFVVHFFGKNRKQLEITISHHRLLL